MTEDYLAVSNTGKNITITMTPGMKHRVLGDNDRVWLRFGQASGSAVLSPDVLGRGYKFLRRKTVWNMSVASARFRRWPKHERIVVPMSGVQMHNLGAIVPLPKPSASIPDKPIAAPAMRPEHINLGGEHFEVLVNSEDMTRFWKAYLRTLEKTEVRHLFNVPDMVVAAVTGACGGFVIALLLAAAGVLK